MADIFEAIPDAVKFRVPKNVFLIACASAGKLNQSRLHKSFFEKFGRLSL